MVYLKLSLFLLYLLYTCDNISILFITGSDRSEFRE